MASLVPEHALLQVKPLDWVSANELFKQFSLLSSCILLHFYLENFRTVWYIYIHLFYATISLLLLLSLLINFINMGKILYR
jgi:hypothetical protein